MIAEFDKSMVAVAVPLCFCGSVLLGATPYAKIWRSEVSMIFQHCEADGLSLPTVSPFHTDWVTWCLGFHICKPRILAIAKSRGAHMESRSSHS